MLFDENYDRLIEILGSCDEDFLMDYQNFIAKFPEQAIAKASDEKDFAKKTNERTYSYFSNSSFSEYVHNLSLLEKNSFSILKVCPCEVFHNLAANGVLSLSIGESAHSKVYSFSVLADENKKYIKSTLNKGNPFNKDNYVSKTQELSDEEFKFILHTISHPFEHRNNHSL